MFINVTNFSENEHLVLNWKNSFFNVFLFKGIISVLIYAIIYPCLAGAFSVLVFLLILVITTGNMVDFMISFFSLYHFQQLPWGLIEVK